MRDKLCSILYACQHPSSNRGLSRKLPQITLTGRINVSDNPVDAQDIYLYHAKKDQVKHHEHSFCQLGISRKLHVVFLSVIWVIVAWLLLPVSGGGSISVMQYNIH